MWRGASVLVLLGVLVVGLALVVTREAVYVATATATTADPAAAARVADAADDPAFTRQLAEVLEARPASAIPGLEVTTDGARVRLAAEDVDPARAQDTVDTAVFLLARDDDTVERTSASQPPSVPANLPSLVVLGAFALALVVLTLSATTATRVSRGRRR